MERDEEECSNTRCELYINKIKLTPDDCDPHMKHGVGKS